MVPKMTRKKLHKTLRSYGKRLSQLGDRVQTGFEGDCIHDLRTTVKKTKALMQCLAKRERKLSPSFRKLYRLSGELRDAQVLLDQVRVLPERPLELVEWLEARLSGLKHEWTLMYDRKVVRRQGKKLRDKQFHKASFDRLDSYLSKASAYLGSVMEHKPVPDQSIHEARKTLKAMQYVIEWYEGTHPALETIRKIGREAGAFNDTCNGVTLLNACMRDMHDAVNPLTINLKDDWEREKLMQKKKVIRALHQFEC
jgi:CHAD domain-containing protein